MATDKRVARDMRSALRGPEGRDRRRTAGEFKQYYSDAQVSASPEGYKQWREAEDQYKAGVKKAEGQISEAKGKVGSAQSEIDDYYSRLGSVKSTVDSSWKKYKKNFIPVYVMNGQQIEDKYYLPKSVASNIAKSQGLRTAWYNNGNQLNVDVKVDGGRIRGKEIHSAMRNAVSDVKTSYYEQAIPKVTKELRATKEVLSGYQSQLNEAKGKLTATEAEVAGKKKIHDDSLKSMRDEYQGKLNRMKEIFGGLTVEKGTANGSSSQPE